MYAFNIPSIEMTDDWRNQPLKSDEKRPRRKNATQVTTAVPIPTGRSSPFLGDDGKLVTPRAFLKQQSNKENQKENEEENRNEQKTEKLNKPKQEKEELMFDMEGGKKTRKKRKNKKRKKERKTKKKRRNRKTKKRKKSKKRKNRKTIKRFRNQRGCKR